jgi:uncharacterized protein
MLRCPTCKKPAAPEAASYWPFCSERCQMIDLGQWFEEKYTITESIKPGHLTGDELSE